MPEKLCHACGEVKPLSEFHTRKDSPDGHRNTCKDCINARLRTARWRKTHPVELVRTPRELPRACATCGYYRPADEFVGECLYSWIHEGHRKLVGVEDSCDKYCSAEHGVMTAWHYEPEPTPATVPKECASIFQRISKIVREVIRR